MLSSFLKVLNKIATKLLKIKSGKANDDLDSAFSKQNIDLDQNDIDQDYMKEVLSWRRKLVSQQSNKYGKRKRDASVPVSRRSDHDSVLSKEQNQDNKRYNSNV